MGMRISLIDAEVQWAGTGLHRGVEMAHQTAAGPVMTARVAENAAVRKGMRPRVLIIGVGFGGLHAAIGLAKLPVDVTLVDRRNHFTFQPLLYQVALAVLSPANIAQPI